MPKTKFWTEPRYCMVLGLKPMGKPTTYQYLSSMVLGLKLMGKPTTYQYLSSFGQNQGIVWSSDSNLWGNQLLISIYQVLDRTKVFYDPRTQTYEETNYLSKSGFGQNQGIAWSSDSNLWGNQLLISIYQVLDRTKVLYGPQTQT